MGRNLSDEAHSKNAQLVKHMEECAELDSSSDEESDDDDGNQETQHSFSTNVDGFVNPSQSPAPATLYRHVTRLNGRHSQTRMINTKAYQEQLMRLQSTITRADEISSIAVDSTDDKGDNVVDDDQDVTFVNNPRPTAEEHNMEEALDAIRQKTVEHDRQQLKGIQLANAGDGNLKVVNSYAVTSSTCNLI